VSFFADFPPGQGEFTSNHRPGYCRHRADALQQPVQENLQRGTGAPRIGLLCASRSCRMSPLRPEEAPPATLLLQLPLQFLDRQAGAEAGAAATRIPLSTLGWPFTSPF